MLVLKFLVALALTSRALAQIEELVFVTCTWTTPANTFSGSQLQEFAQAFAENAALGGTAMPRSDSGQCTSTYLTYNTDAQPLEINITVSFQSSSIDSGTYVTVVPSSPSGPDPAFNNWDYTTTNVPSGPGTPSICTTSAASYDTSTLPNPLYLPGSWPSANAPEYAANVTCTWTPTADTYTSSEVYNFAYTFAHEAASGAQNVYATPTRAGVVSYNLDATPLTVSIIVGFGSGGMASSTSYASTVNGFAVPGAVPEFDSWDYTTNPSLFQVISPGSPSICSSVATFLDLSLYAFPLITPGDLPPANSFLNSTNGTSVVAVSCTWSKPANSFTNGELSEFSSEFAKNVAYGANGYLYGIETPSAVVSYNSDSTDLTVNVAVSFGLSGYFEAEQYSSDVNYQVFDFVFNFWDYTTTLVTSAKSPGYPAFCYSFVDNIQDVSSLGLTFPQHVVEYPTLTSPYQIFASGLKIVVEDLLDCKTKAPECIFVSRSVFSTYIDPYDSNWIAERDTTIDIYLLTQFPTSVSQSDLQLSSGNITNFVAESSQMFIWTIMPSGKGNFSIQVISNNITSNTLYYKYNDQPLSPIFNTGVKLIFSESPIKLVIDPGEQLDTSPSEVIGLFNITNVNSTEIIYDSISGQVYISAVPRSPDVDVFINVPPGAMEDIYGNRNANDTKVALAYRPVSTTVKSGSKAITAVVATTVATAISSSAATSTMVAIGGKALAQISKTASNTGGGAITKLIAFGQLFALSALIQAPGLTDEYKKIAQSTDFLVLKIWRPWAKSTNNNVTVITSSCSNRRLLYADMDTSDGVVHHVWTIHPSAMQYEEIHVHSKTGNRRVLAAAKTGCTLTPASKTNDTSYIAAAKAKQDEFNQAVQQTLGAWERTAQVVFWGTIIFLGFLLFHGFVLGVFHLSGRRPPAFAAFGTVELKFLAFLTPPVTDAAAGLFKKGSAGAIIVGIVLLLAVPVPVIIWVALYIKAAVLGRNSTLRGIFYEVKEDPYKKKDGILANAARGVKDTVYCLTGNPDTNNGEWKAFPGDKNGEAQLIRVKQFIGGTRGPRCVREGDDYKLNPITRKFNRGHLRQIEKPTKRGTTKVTFAEQVRAFTGVWFFARDMFVSLWLGVFNLKTNKRQAGLLVASYGIDLLWMIFARPIEDSNDALQGMWECLTNLANYCMAAGLIVMSTDTFKQGVKSEAGKYTAISRAMVIIMAINLLISTLIALVPNLIKIWNIVSTMREIIKYIKEKRERRKATIEFRKNHENAERLKTARYANRWMSKALHRPMNGWPTSGGTTDEDRILLMHVIEKYVSNEDPKKKEALMKGAATAGCIDPLANSVMAEIPEGQTREQMLEEVSAKREALQAAFFKYKRANRAIKCAAPRADDSASAGKGAKAKKGQVAPAPREDTDVEAGKGKGAN